jgi:glycine/D-amino acid oxidase-like deaminating enzyme
LNRGDLTVAGTDSKPDVLIVGAGIVGAACAYYLTLEGLSVLLLDAGFAGGGTTSAGMGHLAVMDDSEAEFDLCRVSSELWAELAPDMPDYCEMTHEGCLWVAADADEFDSIGPKVDYFNQRGVPVERLDERQLAEAEPELRPGLPGALLLHQDRILYQLGATRWFLEMARGRGAVLREHTPVVALGPGFAETAEGRIEAGGVINACGTHAGRLLQLSASSGATSIPQLTIQPRKGHLVITDRYPGFLRHQVLELGYQKSAHTMSPESVAFNVQPRATGQLLIGSSRELVGWDPSINPAILSQMLGRAFEFLPRLRELSCIRTWTGMRPSTPDKLPYIGRWPLIDGLWIAAGHEGLGIMTATGTARLLTDLMLGRDPSINPRPFDPARVLAGEGLSS